MARNSITNPTDTAQPPEQDTSAKTSTAMATAQAKTYRSLPFFLRMQAYSFRIGHVPSSGYFAQKPHGRCPNHRYDPEKYSGAKQELCRAVELVFCFVLLIFPLTLRPKPLKAKPTPHAPQTERNQHPRGPRSHGGKS